MADTKISALTQDTVPAGTDEYATNQGGTSKRTTLAAVKTFVTTDPDFAAGSGTAGTWPNLASGTVLTTAEAGAWERDTNCMYMTTDAGNRGVLPVTHFIRQHANRAAFANNTNQQAIFDSVTNGTLTLETGAYIFEAMVIVSGTSATSGNLKFSLAGAGGGTFAIIAYLIFAQDAALDTTTAWSGVAETTSTQVATNMATAQIATVTSFLVKGSFECTVAGTLIPSIAQTTGTAAQVTNAGSYFMCNRIGATTVTSVGQWT